MRGPSLLSLGLAVALPLAAEAASGSGRSTRYWDCCKPSCSWPGKALVSQPVQSCDKNDNPLSDPNARSGCEGGESFVCTKEQPWAVNDEVAFGFAATSISGGNEGSWCCACYALTFTSGSVKGKTMVVQSVNTGSDLSENHFDLQIPGGGQGIFSGCNTQFGGMPGAQYGGISDRSECDDMPASLRAGCEWRFDWFGNSDNPSFDFVQVQCPAELTSKSGCVRQDDASFPKFTVPGQVSAPTSPAPVKPTSTKGNAVSSPTAPAGGENTAPTAPGDDDSAPAIPAPTTAGGNDVPTTTAGDVESPTTTNGASCPAPSPEEPEQVAQRWGQCGGNGYTGPTKCASPYTCQVSNEWYSQCL